MEILDRFDREGNEQLEEEDFEDDEDDDEEDFDDDEDEDEDGEEYEDEEEEESPKPKKKRWSAINIFNNIHKMIFNQDFYSLNLYFLKIMLIKFNFHKETK